MAEVSTAHHPKHRMRRFLVLYSAAILLVGAIGLVLLYQYLDAYERSRPENVMDALLADSTEEDWLEVLLAGSGLVTTEFEETDAILRDYFDATCRGKPFHYREAADAYREDAPAYTVRAGSADVCLVRLVPDARLRFGLTSWRVGSMEGRVAPGSLSSVSVLMEAAEEEPVFLNGRAIGADYLAAENVPYQTMTSLERRSADPPMRVSYRVDGLYGSITVTDAAGTVIPAETAEDCVSYVFPERAEYSFAVRAPAAARVYVNGTLLGPEERTGEKAGLLDTLSDYAEGSDAVAFYAASGLYRAPEITAEPPEGYTLERSVDEDGTVRYGFAGDDALAEARMGTAERFFNTYMRYSAGDQNAYSTLLNLILRGTDLYTYVSDSTAAMAWAADTIVDYEYLTFDHFVPWGERCFTCRVSYKADLTVRLWHQTDQYTRENAYDLVFVDYHGRWVAAGMVNVN